MTDDAYWDELGVAWVAQEPNVGVLTPRFEARLRRQSILIRAGLVGVVLLGIAGGIIGPITIWIGATSGAWHFIVRGIAILAVAIVLGAAANALASISAGVGARALPEMIDLSIRRAKRTLLVIRLALLACATAAVLGVAGTAIRSSLSRPPVMSPLIDLVLLGLMALGLALYRRQVGTDRAKFEYLKRALTGSAQ